MRVSFHVMNKLITLCIDNLLWFSIWNSISWNNVEIGNAWLILLSNIQLENEIHLKFNEWHFLPFCFVCFLSMLNLKKLRLICLKAIRIEYVINPTPNYKAEIISHGYSNSIQAMFFCRLQVFRSFYPRAHITINSSVVFLNSCCLCGYFFNSTL